MMEFNADGSLKLPGHIARHVQQKEDRMKKQRCIQVRKEVVSTYSPKKCKVHIRLSEAINDNSFVERIYKFFERDAEVPLKLIPITEKEFDIEVGTCFRRCSECCSLVSRFREHMDGNIIEDKGSCTFKGRNQNFSYEDYFD